MIRWIGILACLASTGALAQDANRIGERAFQRCYSCHSVVKGETGLSGPNLHALGDRTVASDPDFQYSRSFMDFARRNPRWSPALLDQFLADPRAVVPGNQMGFFGLKDARTRAEIVAYLMANK